MVAVIKIMTVTTDVDRINSSFFGHDTLFSSARTCSRKTRIFLNML